jgi:hypothetical protein
MNSSRDQKNEALLAALRVARENANRWMEISADFSTDAERMGKAISHQPRIVSSSLTLSAFVATYISG